LQRGGAFLRLCFPRQCERWVPRCGERLREDRGQKSEVRGQRTEVRGPVIGGRGRCVRGWSRMLSAHLIFLGKNRLGLQNGMRRVGEAHVIGGGTSDLLTGCLPLAGGVAVRAGVGACNPRMSFALVNAGTVAVGSGLCEGGVGLSGVVAVLPRLESVSAYGAGTYVEKARPPKGVATFGGLTFWRPCLDWRF
jgi:hypothetical protein